MQMILLDLEEPTKFPSQGTLLQSKVARKALHGQEDTRVLRLGHLCLALVRNMWWGEEH